MRLENLSKETRKASAFRGLYPAEQFRAAMDRERARADRWEQPLALLSLGVAHGRKGQETLQRVVRILTRRMRLTDEAGWLDSRHIGILMPNTLGWGAWTLADEICLEFPDSVSLPQCKVYCYPSDWFTGDGKRLGDRAQTPAEAGATEAMEPLFFQPLPRWKRAIDFLGAGVASLVFLPLMLLVALAIKLTSRGPIFFAQARDGLGGRPFTIYKFRTMVVGAEQQQASLRARSEQDGPAFKLKEDPRVTRIGRILRATSLDELPQLWNVLKGDMSLVGPRPLPCAESQACRGWHRRRLDVTPGLTCTWQVYGRSRVTFVEWIRMDLRYIRSRAFWPDLKLILMTIPTMIRRRGV